MPATTNPNQKFMGAETSQTRNPAIGRNGKGYESKEQKAAA